MGLSKSRREECYNRILKLMQQYPKILIVEADHVGSRQMADVRFGLRGKAIILMGKNTMIRKALKQLADGDMPQAAKLMPYIRLNVGLVFCIEDPAYVRNAIIKNKVPCAAREKLIAPVNVEVDAGPTGLDPSQTSFFQALGITTKIVKGQIEIQSKVKLIEQGTMVTASQAALLQKLDIRPFAYGLVPLTIYDDGTVYSSSVLDMTDADILRQFSAAVANVAALSRQIGLPTEASAVHSVVEAFKNCTALCIEIDHSFPQMEKLKELVAAA
eukprot:Lankesteria_metandrocarpae@DN2989_c0_g1_i1.p1